MRTIRLLIEFLSAYKKWIIFFFSLLLLLPFILNAQDGTDFMIQTPSNALQDSPDIIYNQQNDEFFVIWRDWRSGYKELFGRRVLSSGFVQGNEVDISVVRDATQGCITHITSTNKYLAVYQRQIWGGSYDLWYQIVNSDASLPANRWGQLTAFSYDATWPEIAYNSSSNRSLLVWSHNINKPSPIQGDGQIYGTRVDKNGYERGSPFVISTSSGGQYFIGFADVCASPSSGNFLVCWDRLNKIYGQRVVITQDTLNSPLTGQNFSITQMSSAIGRPRIIYNSTNDEFLVMWEDNRNGYAEIFGRRVGATSELLSPAFSISGPSQHGQTDLWGESGAYNSKDNTYLICWRDVSAANKENMRGRYVNKNGTTLGDPFTINDAPILEDKTAVLVNYKSGVAYSPVKNKFLVTWVHNLTGYNNDIYGDLVDASPAKPNLILQSGTRPFNCPGLTINVTIKNDLSTNAGASTLGYYLSTDQNITTSDVKLGTDNVPALAGGATSNQSITISDICNVTGVSNGTWYVGYIIDENNAVNEAVESDNAGVLPPAINVTCCGNNNTNPGTNVQVNLSSDVTITFDNVTAAGNTTLNQKSSGSPPPNGFSIVPTSSPVYYDINTTATFTGNIKICIKYNDTGMTAAQENSLTLQVYEVPPGSWKDITISRDATANVICGQVNHLTDFAVMVPTGTSNTQTISLPQGWSWISFYVQPSDLSIEHIFQAVPELQIAINGAGQFYMPGVIDNIGQISVTDGYKVYLNAASQVTVTGQPVSLSTQINLNAGWNFISYLPNVENSAETTFNSILSQLALVKNDDGKFFMPGVINTLGSMKPGEGYYLYMNSSAVFTYPSP